MEEIIGRVGSSLIYRFVTHFWSPYRAGIEYIFSLEQESKREIRARQKGDGAAMGREGAPSQDGRIYDFSLEQ
jgi:hypothetical protein